MNENEGREEREDPSAAGAVVIGEFTGGSAAAGEEAVAEDRGRLIGRPGFPGTPPPPVAPVRGGVAIGRMTGGAVASGKGARAVYAAEQLVEATPELLEALRLLRTGQPPAGPHPEPSAQRELRQAAAEVERELEEAGAVPAGRMRKLRELAVRAGTSVAGNAAAGVLATAIAQALGMG